MTVPVGIALGSNLGDSTAELDAGIAFLRSLSASGQIREAPRLQTEPVDCPPGSPPFLNTVAEIELDPAVLPPRELLGMLQAFELSRGRAKVRVVNAPRPLDLDIIYYGDVVVNEPDLVIPHPRAHLRPFVLEPLSHLRPGFVLPKHTDKIASHWKKNAAIAAKRVAIFLGGIFLLWYAVYGGEVFGPGQDAADVKSKISSFLLACPPDEMRFARYLYGGRYVNLVLNFTDRKPLAGIWDDHLGAWGLFWTRGFPPVSPTIWGNVGDPRPDYPSTMTAWHPTGRGIPYTRDEISRIKNALVALPEPKTSTPDSYGERWHLAFWQDGHLRVCDYTEQEMHDNCYKLYGWMGIYLD